MKISPLPIFIGAILVVACNSQPTPSAAPESTMPEKQEAPRYEKNTEPSYESEKSPQESESINGVYSYTGGDAKSEIVIMESTWTGSFTFVSGFGAEYDSGNTEYQSGIVRGKDLYDESGYVKIGYVQGRSLTTTVGGQYLTLRKR